MKLIGSNVAIAAARFGVPLALALAAAPLVAQEIPARPEDIVFSPLVFEPPRAADYRHELGNGVPVYLAPSKEVPLINIVLTFKGGAYLEPEGLVGLARATGAMMRRGGTTTVSAEDMDEQFDFLAANASVSVGDTRSTVSLNCLSSEFDECLALLMDMVRNPGFQENRFALYEQEQIEAMRQRNDFPESILDREWSRLLYGKDHFEARRSTESMLQAMSVRDLREMHQVIFHPGNLLIAVSGDFEPQDMLRRLEVAMRDWSARPAAADPPAPVASFTPGVYHVEKDIPQGKVFIGLRAIERDDADYFPMLLMNDILGGGGFTSRITQRVRSDEGLAYSAGSSLLVRIRYPGEWRASFQSKNRTVALSAKIVLEEIERIRNEPVSADELETARNSFIETFPRNFESKAGMLGVFVSDELTGRATDYWATFRDKLRQVTPDDIRRVALKRLDPEALAMFIVGKWEEIEPGDLEGRASMQDFFGGQVTHLPLRDPLSLEPMN